MAPLNDEYDYYKRMFELQEKLRKSEEKRIRLEEQFNALVRESHNRHEACINRLRMRYIQYLEDQRMRDERNHKLLAALDKVTNRLTLISAKKDRLNILRKQYETYLLRIYSNHRLPDSVTGDSGIASQNEKKRPRELVGAEHVNLASAEIGGVSSPRIYQTPLQSSQPRSTSALFKICDHNPVNDTSPNNSTILSTMPIPLSVDYNRTSGSCIYTSPANQSDQFVRVPTTAVSNNHQYPSTILSSYRDAFGDLQQDLWNVRVPHTVMSPKSQFDTVPVGRSFGDHAKLSQATSGSPTVAWLPIGDAAQYERHRYSSPIEAPERLNALQQFNPTLATSQPFRYHEANVLTYNPQSRVKESISDAAVLGSFPTIAKSSARSAAPRYPDIDVVDHPRSLYGDINCTRRSTNDTDKVSSHSLTSDDAYELLRRDERFSWNADVEKTSRQPSLTVLETSNVNLDDNDRATTILENELDKYISNIRKLHGVPSQDELDYEQNTSGDILNITLSEDEFSTEDKKERMPEKVTKILASTNDLAFRTANSGEITFQIRRSDNANSGTENKVKQQTAPSNTLKLEDRHDIFTDEAENDPATKLRSEIKERNAGDVATHSSELKLYKDADTAKENDNNTNDLIASRECGRETLRYDAKEETLSSNNKLPRNDQGNTSLKKQPLVVENLGEESIIENLFDTAEQLAPWDLANIQKKVQQLHLNDDPYTDQETEREAKEMADNTLGKESANESHASARFTEQGTEDGETNNPLQDTLSSPSKTQRSDDGCKAEHHEQIETRAYTEESFEVSDRHREPKMNELADVAPQINAEFGERDESDERRDKGEMSEARIDDLTESVERIVDEYNVEQEYIEHEHNGTQRYNEQDPNEQYDYHQNLPYGDVANEGYENYADQGYAQENQEYVEYVDSQYEKYVEDPNNQQYQHDLDAQYQQDPNETYDYNYDQQYNADQEYDPNQVYEYAENVPYDPSETYECEGERKEQPDDDIKVEDCEGTPETKETSSEREDKISERKVDEDGDRHDSQQVSAVNGTNRSKKNTDVIKSLLDSDTDTTIERNVSNTESDDFDFN